MPTLTFDHKSPTSTLNQGGPTSANVIKLKRSPVHIVGGALLVIVLSLAFMWTQLRSDSSVSVLAVARPIAVGQTIAQADLREATVVPDPATQLVPASEASTVVGRRATVPLVAGTLLSPAQVGPPAWPVPGDAVVALPLKPGRLPAGITPGAQVRVFTVGPALPAGVTAEPITGVAATVIAVAGDVDASGTVVVSLLLRSADAATVAASPGEAALILVGLED